MTTPVMPNDINQSEYTLQSSDTELTTNTSFQQHCTEERTQQMADQITEQNIRLL